jgi:predicted transcriptional regulator
MRKLVAFLSVCCVSLAIACGALYRELVQERATQSSAALLATPGRVAAADAPLSLEAEDAPDVESPFPSVPIASTPPPDAGAERRPNRQAERRAEMRAELERRRTDPEWQARALIRSKAEIRRRRPDLGNVLGLNSQQEEALVDLLARQQMQTEELAETVRFASESEQKALRQQGEAVMQQQQQERAQLLGARYESFQEYTRQVPERQQLRELRSRLDANASLTESQTNRLVAAMYQERDSYLQQMGAVESYAGYSSIYPFLAASRDRDPQAQIRFAEEQVARTEDFQSRLRQRASQILSAEQLRRFDEMQEEQLQLVRNQIERAKRRAERQARGQSRPGSSTR